MTLTRRALLAAGALSGATACTGGSSPGPTPVDPDVALLAAAITREQALVDAYDGALAASPAQATRWSALRGDHLAHLDRLATAAAATATGSGSDSGTGAQVTSAPSTRATTAPAVSPPPGRAELLRLERAAARDHAAAVVTASRVLAPVLASLAACEASHAVLL